MAPVTLKNTSGKWIIGSSILGSSMAFIDGTALNLILPSQQEGLSVLAFLRAFMSFIFIRNTAMVINNS